MAISDGKPNTKYNARVEDIRSDEYPMLNGNYLLMLLPHLNSLPDRTQDPSTWTTPGQLPTPSP